MIKRITLCRYVPQGVWFCHNTEPFFRTLAQPFFRAVVLFFFCTHKNAYTYIGGLHATKMKVKKFKPSFCHHRAS